METKYKKRKFMAMLCPECGSRMREVEQSHIKNGVTYSEISFECMDDDGCGYNESFINKRDRRKIDFE